jgi:CDP-glucose 4,6-dehydratase
MGTAHVLEGVRKLNKRCDVVVITTDKVYENIEQDIAYKETDRLNGFDPYSNSKACCELVCDSYRNSFFNAAEYGQKHQVSLATTRSGNVIGGGDWSENRIIPDTAKALMNEWPLVLRNPNAIRPWQHVLDPIYGYLLLGANLIQHNTQFNGAYNFGPEYTDRLTVGELAEEAVKIWGTGTISYEEEKNKPHEAGLLMLDSAKAIAILGWKPGFDSKSAVKYTMEWYKCYSSEPKQFTINQINEYIKNIK